MSNDNFLPYSGLRANSPVFVPSSGQKQIETNNHKLATSPSRRKNKNQTMILNKLAKFPFFHINTTDQFDSRESEEEEDDSVNSYYLLPDFHEFRTFTSSVQIPSDFHRMVKEVLLCLPVIKVAEKYNGKIFGGLLREMIWIAFQPFTFNSKVEKLASYLTQNYANIWIPDLSSASNLPVTTTGRCFRKETIPNNKIAIKTICCSKTNTHYQIITSSIFSHLDDATINSLVLTLFPSHNYKLSVRGMNNDLSVTLDDIKKRRLHIITSEIKGSFNLSNILLRAGILFENGWKPLNIEDRELVRNLFQQSSSTLIMKSDRNPLLKENKTKFSSSYLIYRLLISYYPNLTELVNPICHDQIKACCLLSIMNNDQSNLNNLLKISSLPDIKFSLYIASETGTVKTFKLFFNCLYIPDKKMTTQKCLVIALLHENTEIINYVNRRGTDLLRGRKIFFPDTNICWHQHKKNAPCNFKEMGQIVNQIKINRFNQSRSYGNPSRT